MIATLLNEKLTAIRREMQETPRATTMTPGIRNVLTTLLDALDGCLMKSIGGSNTQENSSKVEKVVLEMMGVPLLEKRKDNKKTLAKLSAFAGDYFGFKRAVEHRNECRFVLPETDGVYAIYQPYGSQSNPDILLIEIRDHKIAGQFGIEIKSGGPTWNTHIQFADRSMLYIAIKQTIHYFFGDHVRSKESLILALAWDELQREIADGLNEIAQTNGLKNMCVPYPKQEFRGLNLDEGRDARHAEIRAWLLASPLPYVEQNEQEQRSQSV
jgi:hypothetical protein